MRKTFSFLLKHSTLLLSSLETGKRVLLTKIWKKKKNLVVELVVNALRPSLLKRVQEHNPNNHSLSLTNQAQHVQVCKYLLLPLPLPLQIFFLFFALFDPKKILVIKERKKTKKLHIEGTKTSSLLKPRVKIRIIAKFQEVQRSITILSNKC